MAKRREGRCEIRQEREALSELASRLIKFCLLEVQNHGVTGHLKLCLAYHATVVSRNFAGVALICREPHRNWLEDMIPVMSTKGSF